MKDVIESLMKSKFVIRPSGTVIELGEVFTIQRKGGDGGKLCANQMQFKLIFSRLNIPETKKLEFPL